MRANVAHRPEVAWLALLIAGCPAAPSSAPAVEPEAVTGAPAPLATTAAVTAGGTANPPTNSGSALREAWYKDQPLLSPAIVGGSTFGQRFSVPVAGQVYGQPLV